MLSLKQYIEEIRAASDDAFPVFKISFAEVYHDKLKALGVQCGNIHTTRLKNRLLQVCPSLQAIGSSGMDTLISFKKDVDNVIRATIST